MSVHEKLGCTPAAAEHWESCDDCGVFSDRDGDKPTYFCHIGDVLNNDANYGPQTWERWDYFQQTPAERLRRSEAQLDAVDISKMPLIQQVFWPALRDQLLSAARFAVVLNRIPDAPDKSVPFRITKR